MNYKPAFNTIQTKQIKMWKLTAIQIIIHIVQIKLKVKETVLIKNQTLSHIQSANNKAKWKPV